MEDQKRRMEAPSQKVQDLREKHQEENRLTVIIMKSVGKVRSFRIAPNFIIFALIFFLGYAVVSLYIINDYVSLRRADSINSATIEELETSEADIKKQFDKASRYVAILEDYIKNMEARIEEEKIPGTEAKNRVSRELASKEDLPKPEVKKPEQIYSDKVDVRDMVIQKDGSIMMVNFKIVNLNPGGDAVGGYLHTFAVGENLAGNENWTYPKQKLKDLMPVNYRRGLLFLIQRFRPIEAKFNTPANGEQPAAIKIIVFDQAGQVILKKEFEVRNVS